MSLYSEMSREALENEYSDCVSQYNAFCSQGLKIDMSRGKPGADVLTFSSAVLSTVSDATGYKSEDGIDCRNYGGLGGISECKRLFGEILGMEPDNVIVCGNSSLSLMFDYITQCMITGISGCRPWHELKKIKFLCPVPGYDRHFAICEYYGIEMINIPMNENGPDVDEIEKYISDPSVKGMFCVPKYSNPTGITYSDETVRRIAALKPAAKDFRIIWDNAYIVHDFTDKPDKLLNIYPELEKNGSEDMLIELTSTSKISFPGAGVSVICGSPANVKDILSRMTVQIISYDKINQLRHARYFKSLRDVTDHMKLYAHILKPKFDCVLNCLDTELRDLGIAEWNVPNGGYFISLDVFGGSAAKVGQLCKEAGLTLTKVGATFPYGKDPNDRNIRIAPTYPPVKELSIAVELLCICVKISCLEYLLGAE